MTLANLDIDKTSFIKKIRGETAMKARLITLGFFTGNSIHVIHQSFGNTVLRVGATVIAISSKLLKLIEIEEINE
jgi:Fe2+ transport system protein FeoA